MREETEIITQGKKRILVDPELSFSVQVGKDAPVFPEQAVNIPHKIVCITVKLVVVIVSALVRAEFLIGTAAYCAAAIETFPFHSTNVLLKLQKIAGKRQQTTINDFETGINI